jgi:solute carrier family 35, member C2
MVKSSAPIFVFLFAILFRIERPTWLLAITVLLICLGVVLMVSDGGPTDVNGATFDWIGFAQVQSASVMSGLRWALSQVLLEKAELGMYVCRELEEQHI